MSVVGGAQDDSAFDILRKHLSSVFKGKAWDALLEAVASGDEYTRDLAKSAYDQLFVATAGGKYLDKRGSGEGLQRPYGMSDEEFREYIIALTNKKVTLDSVLEVLEVFYGQDALRAYIQTAAEPFNLIEGSSLALLSDGESISFEARNVDYHDPSAASAAEVASAYNMQAHEQGSQSYADTYTDSNGTYVRFYSGARGLRATLRLVGGELAYTMGLPGQRTSKYTIAWTITKTGKTVRLTANFTGFDWREGDIVLLRSGWGSNAGSFKLTNVYDNGGAGSYVEFENEFAVVGSYTSALNDIIVWADKKYTVDLTNAPAAMKGEVVLPVLTAVVERNTATAAYLPPEGSVARVGYDGVHPDNTYANDNETTFTPLTLTKPFTASSFAFWLAWTNSVTSTVKWKVVVYKPNANWTQATRYWVSPEFVGMTTGENKVTFNGPMLSPGNWLFGILANERVTVSGKSTALPVTYIAVDNYESGPASFYDQLPGVSMNYYMYMDGAETSVDIAPDGPFIYDPANGLALTKTQSVTAAAILAKQSLRSITLADASDFPDAPGWLVFGLGWDYQAAPVRYLGKNGNALLLDHSYKFAQAIPSGSSVILLAKRGAWQPEFGQYDDEFTLTNTGIGFRSAEAAAEAVSSAGLPLKKTLLYPPDYGYGGAGAATTGEGKLSDVVRIYGGDDIDEEVEKARNR